MLRSVRWWVVAAALLGAGYVWLLIVNLGESTTAAAISLLSGAALVVGLYVRPHSLALSSWLLILGSLWGIFLFWTLVGPILGIAVIYGALRDQLGARKAT